MAIEDISKQLRKCQILRDKIREISNQIEFHEKNLASLREQWRELAAKKSRSKDPNEKETISYYLSENVRQQDDEKLRLSYKIQRLKELENDYQFNGCE